MIMQNLLLGHGRYLVVFSCNAAIANIVTSAQTDFVVPAPGPDT